MKTVHLMFLVIIMLTGLNAGLGFANAIGYIPAMEDTPANHILSFWQHADHYFRKRMPFFGNAILVSILITIGLLFKEWKTVTFLLLVLTLLVCIGELLVIFTRNLPLNKIIETLDPEKPLNIDFEMIRTKAVAAFYLRAFLNVLAFALTLAASMTYLQSHFKIERSI